MKIYLNVFAYKCDQHSFFNTNFMKKLLLSIVILTLTILSISAQSGHKALLIIDIQDFYFPGGKSALVEPEKAAANAALLLADFRSRKLLVIHVRHNAEPGGKINDIVKPLMAEKIVSKDEVNCFLRTDLLDYLKTNKIDTLVICGMQTHMCVEAATRAASDYGFKCILVHDACATKDLKFGDKIIKAEDVHYSTLSTLKNYSTVESTKEYLKR
jgi:nicotinamidase-related amidase